MTLMAVTTAAEVVHNAQSSSAVLMTAMVNNPQDGRDEP
jgi:hypothetical protein